MVIGASCGNGDYSGPARLPTDGTRYPAAVLIVDQDPLERKQLQHKLAAHCVLVEAAGDLHKAEALRTRCHFDVFVVALGGTGTQTLDWLQALRERGTRADVILTAACADLDTAISALRAGAADLLVKPYRDVQLLSSIRHCLRRRQMLRESFLLRRREAAVPRVAGMIGDSPAMRRLLGLIERIAPTMSTVLIEGETGTGKELIARAVHRHSGRKGEFIAVNCGAITPELLESELFGHTRGAFTGAHCAREGLFACANDGTLFLDEIGEMPLAMQANLLRVLEQRCVRPVGANRERAVNCRVIAATNLTLAEQVAKGAFREDLYYRLNVLTVAAPTLRERLEDIPALVEHFTGLLSDELGVEPLRLDHADFVELRNYSWPGNVRELRNMIERALLLGQLPRERPVSDGGANDEPSRRAGEAALHAFPYDWTLSEVEKHHMLNVLHSVGGNKSEAARRLGVSRKTLERKLNVWNRKP